MRRVSLLEAAAPARVRPIVERLKRMIELAIRKTRTVDLRRREEDSWALTSKSGFQVLKVWAMEPIHVLD